MLLYVRVTVKLKGSILSDRDKTETSLLCLIRKTFRGLAQMAALWFLGWNLNKDPHFPQPRYICALRARLAPLILSGVRHRG